MPDDGKIRIQFNFKLLDDNSLAALDAIANGTIPVNEALVRELAKAIAINGRALRDIAAHIHRLSTLGDVHIG